MISPFLSGLFLSASLIIAIGAQNAFILRQGLLRQHVFILCLICALSDALLIIAGVLGLGALVEQVPSLISLVTLGGAAFLFCYGFLATRRALRPEKMDNKARGQANLQSAILTCLAFTFLNPHVYLDTFILVGGLAAGYAPGPRIWFASGAVSASFLWFFGLGYGARLLTPFFAKARSWQILDSLIAIVMFGLALSLLVRFFNA